MMRLNGYLDVLIPRGGAGLIRNVVENSTVPVIQTGIGNCHIYVDESADLQKLQILLSMPKHKRPGVCNACESLLVHKNIAKNLCQKLEKALQSKNVEIRGDKATINLIEGAIPATEQDWVTEYEKIFIISAKK